MAKKKLEQFEETPVTDADKEIIEFVSTHCTEWRNNSNTVH